MSISFAILGANLCFIAVASKKNHSQVLPTYESFYVLGVVGSRITCLFCEKGITLRLKILTRSRGVFSGETPFLLNSLAMKIPVARNYR